MRDPLIRNSLTTVAAALAFLICASAFVVWHLWSLAFPYRPPERIAMSYFYDLNTGEVFEAPAVLPGPLATASGLHQGMPAGVRAVMFSCGRCGDPAQRFVGWLEAPLAALATLGVKAPPPPGNSEGPSETLIRSLDHDRWVFIASHEGHEIVNRARRRCGPEGTVTCCHPKRRLVSEVDATQLAAARPILNELAADE